MEGVEYLSALDRVRHSDPYTQINYLGCPLKCDSFSLAEICNQNILRSPLYGTNALLFGASRTVSSICTS